MSIRKSWSNGSRTQMSELTPEERQLLVMEAQWKGEKNREVHAAQVGSLILQYCHAG